MTLTDSQRARLTALITTELQRQVGPALTAGVDRTAVFAEIDRRRRAIEASR